MIKTVAILIAFLSVCKVNSESFYKWSDGNIHGAKWKVTTDTFTTPAQYAWTQDELDKISERLSFYGHSHSTITLSASTLETNLSTNTVRINFNTFQKPTRKGIRREIIELKKVYDLENEIDPNGTETADLRQRLNWLKHYYKSLAQ